MKRTIAVLVALALVPLLAGCPDSPPPSTERRPGAPQAHPQPTPHVGAQQPGPHQADPSAHNEQPGEVDLHVEWSSENKHTPACEWSKNAPGKTHPCEGLRDAVQEEGHPDYFGLWEREEQGKAGDIFQLNAHGWPGTKSIACSIFWKGTYHALPTSADGKQCGGTYTLD